MKFRADGSGFQQPAKDALLGFRDRVLLEVVDVLRFRIGRGVLILRTLRIPVPVPHLIALSTPGFGLRLIQ